MIENSYSPCGPIENTRYIKSPITIDNIVEEIEMSPNEDIIKVLDAIDSNFYMVREFMRDEYPDMNDASKYTAAMNHIKAAMRILKSIEG